MAALVISVHFHEGRYHGEGEWPPGPARLFQALVAGAGISGPLGEGDEAALRWLENLKPPVVAAPRSWRPRRAVVLYVPNNDSDAIKGDPSRMSRIRSATKTIRPHIFDVQVPVHYAWEFDEGQESLALAETTAHLAERLYQLGRGWDMAWACADVVNSEQLRQLLEGYPGEVYRPSEGGGGFLLRTPCPGTVDSLARRHEAFGRRFLRVKIGRTVQVTFRQPPKARYRLVPYNSPPARQLYELRDPVDENTFMAWPVARAGELVTRLRDAAVEKLKGALPDRSADIARVLIGRRPDGSNDCPPEKRVRIVPLPSIGHFHADREVRRVLVETPPGCLVSPGDIEWAFSGLDVIDQRTGSILATLARSENREFLRHYGIEKETSFRVWRTVTPAVVGAEIAVQGNHGAGGKGRAGSGTAREEALARLAGAARQCVRQAGISAGVESIRFQREPFEAHGQRAEEFAQGTRFHGRWLWHIELRLQEPVAGPIVIGDGRFCGLGLMAPVKVWAGVHAFQCVSGFAGETDPEALARSLRKAVMARVQELATGSLPVYFTGHESGGQKAQWPENPHLAFSFDPVRRRLLTIAPHVFQKRVPDAEELKHLELLDRALEGLAELRAGRAGVLRLAPESVDAESDPLVAPAKVWESVTPYLVTRHARVADAHQALKKDVREQLRAHGFPEAEVTVLECRAAPRRGLEGRVRVTFGMAVRGPMLIGRNRYLGGGLFAGKDNSRG